MPLVVRHISKSYSTKKVLNDVSFTISSNEVVGLLGKNGAGKTTLLKILAGISSQYNGEVSLAPKLQSISEAYKFKVGYMSEKNPLYPEMYVTEYISWIAETFGVTDVKRRVDQVILDAGLSDMKSRKIGELSKGYKQRVGLAAAIVHDPELLLLDEPINGLDPAQILQYRTLIKKLSKGRIIVLSSHLMQEIEALCTRIILIEDGAVAKDEVLHDSSGLKTIQALVLRTDAEMPSYDWKKIEGVLNYKRLDNAEIVINYNTDIDPRKHLMVAIMDQGRYILEMREHREELDQLFHE